jgi:hypothetical protein
VADEAIRAIGAPTLVLSSDHDVMLPEGAVAFARSWTKAKTEQDQMLTPEYAYLTDLKHRRADGAWKALRMAKAKSVLKTLARIAPTRRAAEGRQSH